MNPDQLLASALQEAVGQYRRALGEPDDLPWPAGPPAPLSRIREVEARLGVALPVSLVTLYSLADGVAGPVQLFPGLNQLVHEMESELSSVFGEVIEMGMAQGAVPELPVLFVGNNESFLYYHELSDEIGGRIGSFTPEEARFTVAAPSILTALDAWGALAKQQLLQSKRDPSGTPHIGLNYERSDEARAVLDHGSWHPSLAMI